MRKWLWLSGLVLALDQLGKWLAENALTLHRPQAVAPFFNWTLMYNTGAAFSLLADAGGWQRWLFLGLATGVSVVLTLWIGRLKPTETRLAVALSLILGGAVGNLLDRVWHGHVIDFIDIYYGHWHWPAFNLADAAISIGAVLLVFDQLFGARDRDAAAAR